MSTRKCFLAIIFCVFVFTCNVLSQIKLQGVVTDNGSEPVFNALVEIINQADTAQRQSDRTNEQGQYDIPSKGDGVNDFITHQPGNFNLLQNYPNPFNPSTIISYELSHPAHIRIEIYNVLGRKVKTLVDGFQNAGPGRIVWDATDDKGQGVPAGIYIYSLKAEGVRINRKMLLIDGQKGTAGGGVLQQPESDEHRQNVSKNVMPDKYLLRVIGIDIQTYEQPDLEITSDTTINVTVNRTVTDIDGNVYRTVKIGNQWWMAENLKVAHYRNGDEIPNVADGTDWANLTTGACCSYENNSNIVSTYGLLYNWYAVDDSRNIAPAGWHVPSDAECQTLVDYLGGFAVAGGKMKETGTTHWSSPNTGATNESGFSALPGGHRGKMGASGGNYGYFDGMGLGGGFYSSTSQDNADFAWSRVLYHDRSVGGRFGDYKQAGISIRFVRD